MRLQPLLPLYITLTFLALFVGFIAWRFWQYRKDLRTLLRLEFRRIAIVVCLLCMMLGVSIPGATASPGVANIDVLFLVDTTASMGAEDYAGNRLRIEGIKQDMLALSGRMTGAHMAIVTFDAKVNTVLTYTPNKATFEAAVASLEREVAGSSKGSTIDKPLETAKLLLEESKATNPERARVVFYLGDGEQTLGEEVKSFDELNDLVDGGVVMGYGTGEGAKMLKYTVGGATVQGDDRYVQGVNEATGQFEAAVSKIDEEALQTIASDIGINYVNRNSGGDIAAAYDAGAIQLLVDKGRKIDYYLNLYWLFAIPLVILLFWEWYRIVRMWVQLRAQSAGVKS